MRPGGGKQKGSSFERLVGSVLSLWVSDGARADLFCRTVLSGGQFTISTDDEGSPGDLMANHPLAFEFMALFSIEAKHHKSIDLDKYLFDSAGNNFLARVFKIATAQATKVGRFPLVVAKQNRYPAVVLMDYAVGMAARNTARSSFHYHVLHNSTIMLTLMQHLTTSVKPTLFLTAVKTLQAARPV